MNVPIQLTAQGDENALDFTLNLDTSVLSNPQAMLGSDAAGATLNVNTTQVAEGLYVQAGRFAVGLDPISSAGAQTGPSPPAARIETEAMTTQEVKGVESALAAATTVNLVSTILPAARAAA